MSSILIKSYNDLSDLQKLGVVDFSYSRVDTYNQCPAKYFYSYILKEPRQFNPPAVLGNIVHSVLENILDNDKVLDIGELRDEYAKNLPIWDPNGLIPPDLISAGSTIINEFYDQHAGKEFNIYEKEMSFNFILGIYKIIGFIDRVDIIGDRVNITDYKTGKWEVTQKDVHNNLQLGIYALALHNIFPEKEIYAELYYLRSGKRKGHLFSAEDIENVKVKLLDNIYKIMNDANFLPTSNSRICSYCDHAKSEACGTGVFRNKKNKFR